ncbi:thioredoxin [Patiriisocius marinistellae]|uniref:Thioredoxin n=1 Tax=Patiriisocius marinistellae TaxID=2494560 RepID=A0A5J4FUB9_9FLAO|nr:thioredoxin fold domain-containing protein [Patiriisocius marinistellae]GEQ85363.1 thioredoxin [Patiriisocius marinistellae]
MKYILSLLLLCTIANVAAQDKINWITMDEALAAQEEVPKKIFMDVYTKWCGPCKMLDKNTFSNQDLIKYVNKNFYAVKFNAEGPDPITYQDFTYTNPQYRPDRKGRNATHFFADALKLAGYPSLVFFEDDGNLIQSVPGYKTAQQLELYLKMIASDDYKKVTTSTKWQEYQDDFKSKFKG